MIFILVSKYIEAIWGHRNKKKLESLGYEFTKYGDVVNIKIEEINHSKQRVKVICDLCGKEYETTLTSYFSGHSNGGIDSCYKCATHKGRLLDKNKRAINAFDKLKIFFDEKGYELLTSLGEYTDMKMKVDYICPIHGKQSGCISDLIQGKGCNLCGNLEISKKARLSIDDVIDTVNSVNGNVLLNPEEYVNVFLSNLKIQCQCGNVYITNLNSYKAGKATRCPICTHALSIPASNIKNILENLNISFQQEYRFIDCRDKYSLPFDFYIPNYNLCIEYQGEQHYQPVYGNDSFERQQIHDRIKFDYCRNKCIDLLIIPYWEKDNLEDIIIKKLDEIRKRHDLVS